MKTIEYRVLYNGTLNANGSVTSDPHTAVERVQARDINSGFTKALKKAKEPLGSGAVREIASIQFWQIV